MAVNFSMTIMSFIQFLTALKLRVGGFHALVIVNLVTVKRCKANFFAT